MGIFFERRPSRVSTAMPAIREALRRTVTEGELDQVAGAIARELPPTQGEVAAKRVPLIWGVGFVVALFVAAAILASIVDAQLIVEAQKVVDTQGYESPELHLKLLSDGVRTLLITAAGALSGLILGEAVGTASGSSGKDAADDVE